VNKKDFTRYQKYCLFCENYYPPCDEDEDPSCLMGMDMESKQKCHKRREVKSNGTKRRQRKHNAV